MTFLLVDSGFRFFSHPIAIVLSLFPLMGAIAWTIGGLCYRYLYVGKFGPQDFRRLDVQEEPFITVIIPAHNEEIMIGQTIDYLMNDIDYNNYELLVCDDGSTDATPLILACLQEKYENLRVVRIEANQGKSHAFNVGIAFARGEFILSNDADTVPEPNALWKYMNYFLSPQGQNTAAVTANMDVQNRTRLIEKSQTVEFSSIIGIIKRSQIGVLGNMYAYSGANTMFRKAALYDVGLFRQDRATEDISICWDQQYAGWKADFAPDIMFYMHVPSTIRMLYRQRRRWAKGGTESWLTNFSRVVRHPLVNLPKLVLLADQTGSIIWSLFYLAFTIWLVIRLAIYTAVGDMESFVHTVELALIFTAVISMTGWWQLVAALLLDNHRAKLKYLWFAPLYMLWYWQMNAITIATTLIPAARSVLGFHGSGTWISPTRTKMHSGH